MNWELGTTSLPGFVSSVPELQDRGREGIRGARSFHGGSSGRDIFGNRWTSSNDGVEVSVRSPVYVVDRSVVEMREGSRFDRVVGAEEEGDAFGTKGNC